MGLGFQVCAVPYPQETAELGSRGDSVERSKADPCSGNRLVRVRPVAADRAVRGSTSGSKAQRSFEATAHWQVVGQNGHSRIVLVMAARGLSPVIGQEISLSGRNRLRFQPVDATHAVNRSAGVS